MLRKQRRPAGLPRALPDAWFERRRERVFEVGLLVPTSGSAGIWGPSTIACARLAAEEINRNGGLLGQEVRLRIVDAADEVDDLAERTDQMLDSAQIDAIVGMHISSVRQKLLGAVRGRVPYVYTPLYEGGERTPGVYAIGETPQQQLRPAIHALTERFGLKRWALLGNDYVWPRISHALARNYIGQAGGAVLDDLYLPFGISDFAPVLDRLARSESTGCCCRWWARTRCSSTASSALPAGVCATWCGCRRRSRRTGCSRSARRTPSGLYVAAAYFASVPSDANMAFKERYYTLFGERAPTLNALGQSTYEGMHFLAALLERSERTGDALVAPDARAAAIPQRARRGVHRQRPQAVSDVPGARRRAPVRSRAAAVAQAAVAHSALARLRTRRYLPESEMCSRLHRCRISRSGDPGSTIHTFLSSAPGGTGRSSL